MKHIYLIILAVAALCGCKNGKEADTSAEKETADASQQKLVWTEQESSGDQRIKAVNENNVGFQNYREGKVTIRESCFGARNADDLDMLPTAEAANRKDSMLIKQLNIGSVFMLQPGESGVLVANGETKILVRFQVGELWVWKSAVMASDGAPR